MVSHRSMVSVISTSLSMWVNNSAESSSSELRDCISELIEVFSKEGGSSDASCLTEANFCFRESTRGRVGITADFLEGRACSLMFNKRNRLRRPLISVIIWLFSLTMAILEDEGAVELPKTSDETS